MHEIFPLGSDLLWLDSEWFCCSVATLLKQLSQVTQRLWISHLFCSTYVPKNNQLLITNELRIASSQKAMLAIVISNFNRGM